MLIVPSGAEAITAMQQGAYQSATVTVYDMTATGHPAIISFTNANILSGSLTVSKASSTYDGLELGGMISDELRVGVRSASLSSLSIEGQEISVAISWEHTGRYSPDSLYVFSGIVVEVLNQKDDIYYITALDPCIVFDKRYTLSDLHDYDNANLPMTYPVTVYKLMQNIIRDIGAPYIETRTPIQYATPVNTSVSISGIDEAQGYTYRQILKWCAQIMGVNLRVNHSPTRPMEMWRWKGAGAAVQDAVMIGQSNAYGITVGREDKTYGGIDVIYGDETLYEHENAGEHLQVADNPLLATLHDELSPNDWTNTCWNVSHEIYECLGSYYNSASLRCTSMWYLEPGDLIHVYRASSASYVVIPITSVTHKLNGGTMIKAAVSSTATGSYGNMQAFSGLQLNQLNILLAKNQPTVGGFTPTNANATVVYQSVRQVGSIVYVAMGIQLPAVFGRQNVTLGTLTGVDAPGNTIAVSPCVTTGNTTAYNPASVMISAGGYVALICTEQNDTTVWINTCYQAPLS